MWSHDHEAFEAHDSERKWTRIQSAAFAGLASAALWACLLLFCIPLLRHG